MTHDYARCADGRYGCPRADTCARMLPSDVPHALHVDFWLGVSAMGDEECRYYIARHAMGEGAR